MSNNCYNQPDMVIEHVTCNGESLALTVRDSLSNRVDAALVFFYSPKKPLVFQVSSDNFILESDEVLVTWPGVKIDLVAKEQQEIEVLKITVCGLMDVDTSWLKLYGSDLPFFIFKQNARIRQQLGLCLAASETQLTAATGQLRFHMLVQESLEAWKKDLAPLDRVQAQKTCTRHILFTRLRKARLFIDRYYTSPITIPIIARACNMSATYFIKHFTIVFGVSPRQYIIKKRVTLAKQLLSKHTALKDVVARTGFENDSSFCRLFKKSTGCTSTQYVSSLKALGKDSLQEA